MTVEPSSKSLLAPFRTGPVLLLSACHFIHDVYSAFLAPLLPLLIDKLSMTLTEAGLLTTVMQIPALANPFIGDPGRPFQPALVRGRRPRPSA